MINGHSLTGNSGALQARAFDHSATRPEYYKVLKLKGLAVSLKTRLVRVCRLVCRFVHAVPTTGLQGGSHRTLIRLLVALQNRLVVPPAAQRTEVA